MTPFLRLVPLLALSALSAGALVHCSSSPPTAIEGSGDAGQHADASTFDGGAEDAALSDTGLGDAGDDAATSEDASADATGDDAEASAPDSATPPCNVHTSGTDAGIADPTFQPFTWNLPATGLTFPSWYPPKLAVAPGGDAYVALAVNGPDAGDSPGDPALYVVVMHIQASGALDPSFGTGGLVTLSSWTGLFDLIVDHNGDVVVTGITPSSATIAEGFGLLALRPDGSTDFTIDPINIGIDQPCQGCIVDGADGYLTTSLSSMVNLAPNGVVSKTDTLPAAAQYLVCRMARGATTLSLYCGYDFVGGGEALRYDLHGFLDPSFGSGGAVAWSLEQMFDPWVAPDGSLFIAQEATLGGGPGPNLLDHFRNNGAIDPAYPIVNSVLTAFPLYSAAPRCDGTELFVEQPSPGNLAMEVLGASGPPLTSGGTVGIQLLPDGGTSYSSAGFGIDANGAISVLYQVGLSSIELVRVLPSN